MKRREENLNNRTMKAKREWKRCYVSKNVSVNSRVESSFLEETSCNSLEKLLPRESKCILKNKHGNNW